jgi:pimeloyl-ACP methyl ester carboxylesterase
VLLIRGTESGAEAGGEDGGAKGLFQDYRWAVIEGAGHWVHHDQPEAFLKVVRSFLLGENEVPG